MHRAISYAKPQVDATLACMQVKSPAYVGIVYAVSHGAMCVRGLATYIKNVILKGEVDEAAATMPKLAPKLRVLAKIYDAYIAELVTEAAA